MLRSMNLYPSDVLLIFCGASLSKRCLVGNFVNEADPHLNVGVEEATGISLAFSVIKDPTGEEVFPLEVCVDSPSTKSEVSICCLGLL